MMVVESSEHGISAVAESKARKWRDKIFNKDKDASKASRDAQIDDFLGSSRPNLQVPSQPRAPPRPGLPSPRIDVSISQRPVEAIPQQSSTDPLAYPVNVTSPVKKRRRKGLNVKFSNGPPDVMGEGGDESEVPTKEMISTYRSRSNSSGSTFTDRSEYSPTDEHSSPDAQLQKNTIPPTIAVHPSLSPEDPTWRPPLIQNTQDSEFLLSLGENARGSRLSLRLSSDPNSFARRVQAKMRADEGRVFQKHFAEREDSPKEATTPTDPSPPKLISQPAKTERTSGGTSFWSSVLDALPEESRPARQPSPSPPPAPTSHPSAPAPTRSISNAYPPSRPPPYLKSPHRSNLSTSSFHDSSDEKDSSSQSKSLRNVAAMVSDSALADFSEYVAHFSQMFSMTAEQVKPSMESSLSEWIRACVWWFLKGRGELETFMRSRPGSSSSQAPSPVDSPQQAVVNLAKAWWINQTIVPQHPELAKFGRMSTDAMLAVAKTAGDVRIAHLITLHQNMISHLRGLAMSMKRHKMLPSGSDPPPLLRSIDTSIWIKYPFFAPDISAILSGSISKSMLVDTTARQPDLGDVMPMGDSSRHFCYGRMFVEVHVSSGEDSAQEIAIPCMLSITRERKDWHVIATITSQSELLNITIQADKKQGPTWADVDWHVRGCSMRLRLPRGFELDVHFKQPDFNMIWKIVEYSRKVEASLQPEAGEKKIFEQVLDMFQYMDPRPSKSFPPEPTPRCRIRLFEKTVKITEGTGTRESHRGYRFVAVTSPKVKSLTSVTHQIGDSSPLIFGYLRGDNGAPALMLKVRDGDVDCSMILTFSDAEHRTAMHSLLLGIVPAENESKTAELPLRSFCIDKTSDMSGGLQSRTPLKFSSSSVTVINNGLSDGTTPRTVLSENLRAFVSANWGSVTDRINLGPGDLKIALDVNVQTAMSIYRPPQQDLGFAVAENLVPKELPGELDSFLKTATTNSLIRKYNFINIQDLHTFQHAITGFTVRFDGVASSFAISRRRMVVPIYKKWEATRTRLQIIQQEKIVQLVIFFSDFSHGKCMNFVLKSTDVFESCTRSGKFGIRIVDAKFSLPKSGSDESAEFVCLDMPEYPGEHDDITIYFDSETDQRNFQSAIPGSVRGPSRVGSLRR